MMTDRLRREDIDVFISYSRADARHAKWLAKFLSGMRLLSGGYQAPLKRVFLDTEELAAAPSLPSALQAALARSKRLCVVLSRSALESRWVQQEIQEFKRLHPAAPVFVYYCGSDPLGVGGLQAWARSLGQERHPLFANAEPLAANSTTEGRQVAALRLLAGMLELSFGQVSGRRFRARAAALALAVAGLSLAVGGAEYGRRAFEQRAAEDAIVSRHGLASMPLIACCVELIARNPRVARQTLDQINASDLAYRPLRSSSPLAIAGGETGGDTWEFVADTHSYVSGGDRHLTIFGAGGRRTRVLTQDFFAEAIWSPERQSVLLADRAGVVRSVSLGGDERVISGRSCGRLVKLLTAYVLQMCEGRLIATELRSGAPSEVPRGRLLSWSADGRFLIVTDDQMTVLLDVENRRFTRVSTDAIAGPFGAIDKPDERSVVIVDARGQQVQRYSLTWLDGGLIADVETREPLLFGNGGIHRVACDNEKCRTHLVVQYQEHDAGGNVHHEVAGTTLGGRSVQVRSGIVRLNDSVYDLHAGVFAFSLSAQYSPRMMRVAHIDGELVGILRGGGAITWSEHPMPFDDLTQVREWACENTHGLLLDEALEVAASPGVDIGRRRFSVCRR